MEKSQESTSLSWSNFPLTPSPAIELRTHQQSSTLIRLQSSWLNHLPVVANTTEKSSLQHTRLQGDNSYPNHNKCCSESHVWDHRDSTEYPPISRTPPWRWNASPGTMLCQRLRIHSIMADFSRAGEKQQAALCSCGFLTSLCSPAPTARPFITNPPPHLPPCSHP